MENNSDKELRGKLQNVEFPFDPKAWEQMEAMLEEKRKPKVILWWWVGGIAACLILGMGMYGYHQFASNNAGGKTAVAINSNTTDNELNAANVKDEKSKKGNTISSPVNAIPAGRVSVNAKEDKLAISGNDKRLNSSSTPNSQTSPALGKASVRPSTNARGPAKGEMQTGNAGSGSNTKSLTHNSKSAIESGAIGVGNNAPQPVNVSQDIPTHAGGLDVTNVADGIAEFLTNRMKSELAEAITMNMMRADELTGANIDDQMQKKEGDEVNLKKLKKKVFNYSLGLAANITGATLGPQTGANAFYQIPSYMAGLTHEFMFFKRFAITNSIQFSQTSYKVYDAKTSYQTGLDYYTSKITEIAIPIGLKVYAVSKPKFRFYVAAGVINHIKLKETFDYSYHHTSGSSNLDSLFSPYPSQTYFPGGGGKIPAMSFANNSPNAAFESGTSDFSINKGKRYYASFYASAGAEFIVQKHVVFFTEPLFYMNLEKVGIQDKYKYNLGLSGGIRYQF
jgi:hypothetical protein